MASDVTDTDAVDTAVSADTADSVDAVDAVDTVDTADALDTGDGTDAVDTTVLPDTSDTSDTSDAPEVEPQDVTDTASGPDAVSPIACAELDCDDRGRTCVEAHGNVDAACGGCLVTHVALDALCVPRVSTPTQVTASTDRHADVLVSWRAEEHAVNYRVFRCAAADCTPSAAWVEIASTADRSVSDADTLAPGLPPAPVLTASTTRTDGVLVAWSAVSAPLAPRYRYRVVAVGPGDESAPSQEAIGHRAERPVIGYEQRMKDGTWVAIAGGLVTEWLDTTVPLATIQFGAVSASQGEFATRVSLSAAPPTTTPAGSRAYTLRALTDYGPGAGSDPVSGRRVAGAVTTQWERSQGTTPDAFAALPGATGLTFEDTSAPPDGEIRWYRLAASAPGAQAGVSEATSGSTTPRAGAPANVRATTDLVDSVVVDWGAVGGATGYHVYRNGVKLTSGGPIAATTYRDFAAAAPAASWGAPSGLQATTTDTEKVTLTWTAPTRPLGASATYTVTAVNVAGEGPASPGVSGRRAAPALVGFDVSVQPSGGNQVWFTGFGTETSYTHADPPKGTVNGGSVSASQGSYRGWVRLGHTGGSTTAAPTVTYRVRGRLADATYTPESLTATGRRAVGALTRQWQRSADATATGFGNLAGATTASFDDTTAAGDGAKRFYQVVLAAAGCNPVTVGPVEGWRLAFVQVTGGALHTCAVTSDGKVWCWGGNGDGQLGRGTTGAAPLGPAPVLVSANTPMTGVAEVRSGAASYHTCARKTDGTVWCWGSNGQGRLGNGNTTDSSWPVQVVGLTGATALGTTGEAHSCAVAGGQVRCWGDNGAGQLGNNTVVSSSTPVTVLTAPATALANATHVAAGTVHTCARVSSGQVWCWGVNNFGQLGQATPPDLSKVAIRAGTLSTATQLAAANVYTCARLSSGSVSCWGRDLGGVSTWTAAPTIIAGVATATEVTAALYSTCARATDGTVWCWGGGGDYGNGQASNTTTATAVTGLSGALALGSGSNHHCGVSGGGVYCWGGNISGTLGDGTTTTRTTPVDVLLP